MTRTPPLVLAAVAALAGLGVWAGYASTDAITREALGRACVGIGIAIGAHLALIGAGRHVRRSFGRLHPGLQGPGGPAGSRPPSPRFVGSLAESGADAAEEPATDAGDRQKGAGPSEGVLHEWVAGFVACGLVLLALAAGGALSIPMIALLAGLGWLGLTDRRPWHATPVAATAPQGVSSSAAALAVGVGLLLALAVPLALAPPIDTDELYWHLAAPAKLLREGALPGGWLDPVSSRPMPLQLVYAAILAAGGSAAVKLFHLLLAGGLLAGLWRTVRAHGGSSAAAAWAVALLVGSWSFVEELPLAHDNLPAALLVLAAADAALRGRSHRGRFGLAAGAALAVKYSAAPAIAGLFVLYLLVHARRSPRQAVPDALGALGLALVLVAPWWARNALDGLHPLFPYAGWPDAGLVFVWPQKYGFGRGPLDLLRLPWDLAFRSRTDTFAFLGRVHPAWALWLPAVAWALVRRRGGDHRGDRVVLAGLVAAVAVGVLGWWFGVQWVRHLLPLAPIAALAWGLSMDRIPTDVARLAFVAWALLLPPQWLDHVTRSANAIPVATGAQSREAWLEARVPAWPAVAWINTHTAPDAKIALLFTGEAALVERTVVLGSVEDHTPSRWFVGQDPIAALRAEGVDWAIVQRVRFLPKTYAFLDPPEFERQFRAPEQALEAALVRDGTLHFEDGRYAVWSLTPTAALDDPQAGR